MTVPTYDNFIEPILRLLVANPNGVDAKAAHEAAAATLNLSAEDREQLLPSGSQPMYKNRAGWAHDRLKRAGLSSSPKRGFWKVTPDGVTFAKQHPASFSPELVEKLALGYLSVKLKAEAASLSSYAASLAPPPVAPSSATVSPDDRLGQALTELRQAARTELLEALAQFSPAFFETIVLDLLHRMGYGASREDLQQVGGTG